ncbi:MAG: transcriptional regulator [Pseudomonadota bacterium]
MAESSKRSATRRSPAEGEAGERKRAALDAVSSSIGKGPDSDHDRLIYERIRLGIVSALAVHDMLTFSELKQLFGLTDGNLAGHARKLEQAGYVSCRKVFEGRSPRSEYRLLAKGRRALERYLEHMESLIAATRHS